MYTVGRLAIAAALVVLLWVLGLDWGFALLLAAATYALRLYIGMRQIRRGTAGDIGEPVVKPIPTLLVGAVSVNFEIGDDFVAVEVHVVFVGHQLLEDAREWLHQELPELHRAFCGSRCRPL